MNFFVKNSLRFLPPNIKYICKMLSTVNEETLTKFSKMIVPKLASDKHKGQAGRVGVVGGSFEYTGAPYFAGISALKVGADLVHIFCAKEAGPVIKSFSPELIVHPVLDATDALDAIKPWLDRLHVLVVGPGLGRLPNTLKTVSKLIDICREMKKPLVIDADGLFLVTEKPELIYNYPGVILTPNAMEFSRLFSCDINTKVVIEDIKEKLNKFGENCIILRKGSTDNIYSLKNLAECKTTGSGRRCGGQGDILSGSLATFYCWALQESDRDLRVISACFAACKLVRICNAQGFNIYGRSMTASDMIPQIGDVFKKEFESV